MSNIKWDQRYLEMAELVASWSKDPKAHVGAVIVRDNRVVATGFNGFPAEVEDLVERLDDQTKKLEMIVHAEQNALIVAGKSAEGATIYVHGKPVCATCAGAFVRLLQLCKVTKLCPGQGAQDHCYVLSRATVVHKNLSRFSNDIEIGTERGRACCASCARGALVDRNTQVRFDFIR